MWSGRFREPLNQQFEEWQRSPDTRAKPLTYAQAGPTKGVG